MTLKNSYFGPDVVLGGTEEAGPTWAAGGTIFDWLIDRLSSSTSMWPTATEYTSTRARSSRRGHPGDRACLRDQERFRRNLLHRSSASARTRRDRPAGRGGRRRARGRERGRGGSRAGTR